MITRYATSVDGLQWADQGVVLRGTPGSWDARGTRITAVLNENPLTVLYDGREMLPRIGSSGDRPGSRTGWSTRTGRPASGRGISGQRRFTALCQCRRTPQRPHAVLLKLPAPMVRTI